VTPVAPEVASYSPALVLVAIVFTVWVCYRLLYKRSGLEPRAADPWDCGFGGLNSRMQYSSTAFSMPIRRVFAPVFVLEEDVDEKITGPAGLQITKLHYRLRVSDKSWGWLYEPVARAVAWLARGTARLQTGNIRTYLAYSFFTLLVLLWGIS